MGGYGRQPVPIHLQEVRYELLNMAPVVRLRKWMGVRMLQREMGEMKRDTRSISLNDARRVGVLFTGEDTDTLRAVSDFVGRMRHQGKSVRCLGYVPNPKVAKALGSVHDLEFFSMDDLNIFFRPESRHVVSFIEEKFDMLIDLRMRRRMPLPFMVALSQARFKVGRFNEYDREILDLMIHADDGMSMEEFIAHTERYLTMLDQ